jgi:RNA polymerase sigma factor (TIGR02999 family)
MPVIFADEIVLTFTAMSRAGKVPPLEGRRPECLHELVPLVEGELRRLAHRYMRTERRGHTLQTTALVNEAYIKLVDQVQVDWQNRAHFLGVAARQMRYILVDHARELCREKRGGDAHNLPLDEGLVFSPQKSPELVALDDALNELAGFDPRKAQVVELRYFGGMSVEETAEVLGVHPKTVLRDWRLAKLWLKRELSLRGGGTR